jgi:hypothetical protein
VITPEKVSEKAVESAKAFLSGIFMGLRTLQIHDPSNRAVGNAIRTTFDAASTLYAATGGFKIQFVDGTVFLNGSRIRFDSGMYHSLRTLEAALRSKQVGGFAMSQAPSFDALETLIVELAREGDLRPGALESLPIDALGLQAFGDDRGKVSIDRRLLAVQSYAKLILALREQLERGRLARAGGRTIPIRLRVVRILQDLVELVGERPDFLLRLSTNLTGAPPEELFGVNTAMLAIAMGQALGLERRDLVDLAMGALFHHTPPGRMFAEAGVSRSSLLRAVVVAHHKKRADGRAKLRPRQPHLFARITAVASAYGRLVSGYGAKVPAQAGPLDALEVLMEDTSGRFDPDLVDLLINVLRAFPVGCRVVLETGEQAIVTSHFGGSRWDRPVVAVEGSRARNVDLMVADGGRFAHRIAATARYLGQAPIPDEATQPPIPNDSPLLEAVLAEETRSTPPPAASPSGEEMDELFKEFLAEDKKKKPRIDTSYSSKTKGRE